MDYASELSISQEKEAINMKNLQLTKIPIAKVEMLIRKPVAEVFEACSTSTSVKFQGSMRFHFVTILAIDKIIL